MYRKLGYKPKGQSALLYFCVNAMSLSEQSCLAYSMSPTRKLILLFYFETI